MNGQSDSPVLPHASGNIRAPGFPLHTPLHSVPTIVSTTLIFRDHLVKRKERERETEVLFASTCYAGERGGMFHQAGANGIGRKRNQQRHCSLDFASLHCAMDIF